MGEGTAPCGLQAECPCFGCHQADLQASQRPSQRGDGETNPNEFHTVAIESKHLLKLLTALANGSHTIACGCSPLLALTHMLPSALHHPAPPLTTSVSY